MSLTFEAKRNLWRSMLRIRRVQERIESEYLKDEMKTPVHLYIGQEAIATGVCAALRADDAINSNHRSHGHYLAKGGDLKAMMAELFCRSTGCSKGYGGSMHLVDVAHGNMGTSAIVGGGIPIGTGQGLAFQMQKLDRVSVVFFGDGAADEGTFYESLNFALLKKLPVVYVMENNGWAVCSPTNTRHCGDNVFHKGATDRLFSAKIDGNDPELVLETAQKAVERARRGEGAVLHRMRDLPHPGPCRVRFPGPQGLPRPGRDRGLADALSGLRLPGQTSGRVRPGRPGPGRGRDGDQRRDRRGLCLCAPKPAAHGG